MERIGKFLMFEDVNGVTHVVNVDHIVTVRENPLSSSDRPGSVGTLSISLTIPTWHIRVEIGLTDFLQFLDD